jgi:hypothetical protein
MTDAHRPEDTLLSDEEVRRRMRESRVVQARIEEMLAARAKGRSDAAPGMTVEELQDFLREHG